MHCCSTCGIIRKKFIYLHAAEQVKQIGFNLRHHLVWENVYPLLREKGSSCCGKNRCETFFNIKETKTFESFVIKKVCEINHYFHCDSKCFVYLLSCKVCGLQYFGSTVDRFRLRWKSYKCSHRVALEGGTLRQNYFLNIS